MAGEIHRAALDEAGSENMTEETKNIQLEDGFGALSISSQQKRTDYIDWPTYFMSIACLVSKRSKDPSTQVGACIINTKNRIVGVGYNGMPRGCNDEDFPWAKDSSNPLETKYFFVCHAEMNACFNKNCADISNCVIYTILFPCNQCAKVIIQSGISEVVYLGDKNMNKPEAQAAKRMFEASGVKCRQFKPDCGGFKINFERFVCEECPPNSIPAEQRLCLPWEDYFLALSILVAKRSKCPQLQLGAVIVNPKSYAIVGQGYNGMPYGCDDDVFPWGVGSQDPTENKELYECHAELNAILNAWSQVKDCTIYTISYPCNECAKAIIQSGITTVIHLQSKEDKPEHVAAQMMFQAVGVITRQHTPFKSHVFVDFSLIDK